MAHRNKFYPLANDLTEPHAYNENRQKPRPTRPRAPHRENNSGSRRQQYQKYQSHHSKKACPTSPTLGSCASSGIYSRQSSFSSVGSRRSSPSELVSADSDYDTLSSNTSSPEKPQRRQIWEIFNEWSHEFSMKHGMGPVKVPLKKPRYVYTMSDMIDIRQRKFEKTLPGKISKLSVPQVAEQLDLVKGRFLWYLNEENTAYVAQLQSWLEFLARIAGNDILSDPDNGQSRKKSKRGTSISQEQLELKHKHMRDSHLCYVERVLVQALEYQKMPNKKFILAVGPTGVADTKYFYNVANRADYQNIPQASYRFIEPVPEQQWAGNENHGPPSNRSRCVKPPVENEWTLTHF